MTAENLIKLLGGQADDETGSFELTKNQFVEAFENGQLTYHACLPFDFVDRVVHSQMKQKALILGGQSSGRGRVGGVGLGFGFPLEI